MMLLIILWLVAGIVTMLLVNDVKTLKFNYILLWICLMVNLIERYAGA